MFFKEECCFVFFLAEEKTHFKTKPVIHVIYYIQKELTGL